MSDTEIVKMEKGIKTRAISSVHCLYFGLSCWAKIATL